MLALSVIEFDTSDVGQKVLCHVRLWWDVDGCNDDPSELPGNIEWTTSDREMLQVWRAEARKSLNILRVAPIVVGHEANPSTIGFA